MKLCANIVNYSLFAIVILGAKGATMAATERDIREMLARDRERQKPKPERHTEAGRKMALDILHHFKFPGDQSATSQQTGGSDGGNVEKPTEYNQKANTTKSGKRKETET